MKALEKLRLVRRRELWLPTWRGCLLIVVGGIALLAGLIRGLHPFLAVHDPVKADVMVMEGWVPDLALPEAIRLFHQDGYRQMLVTGGPLDKGEVLAEYRTYAELGFAQLARAGFPTNRLNAVSTPRVQRDRTYASARAVRSWLLAHGGVPRQINIFTSGSHARRTRLLYDKAFGDETEVGIITVPDTRFDYEHWWRSSLGFRTVSDEAIAYLYARFLFKRPPDIATAQ